MCDRKEVDRPSDNSSQENPKSIRVDSSLVTSSFDNSPQVTLSNDMKVVNGSDLKSQIVSEHIANDRRVVGFSVLKKKSNLKVKFWIVFG